mgnify:CR=1 FL=1
MSIWTQKSALIQLRTSLLKFWLKNLRKVRYRTKHLSRQSAGCRLGTGPAGCRDSGQRLAVVRRRPRPAVRSRSRQQVASCPDQDRYRSRPAVDRHRRYGQAELGPSFLQRRPRLRRASRSRRSCAVTPRRSAASAASPRRGSRARSASSGAWRATCSSWPRSTTRRT